MSATKCKLLLQIRQVWILVFHFSLFTVSFSLQTFYDAFFTPVCFNAGTTIGKSGGGETLRAVTEYRRSSSLFFAVSSQNVLVLTVSAPKSRFNKFKRLISCILKQNAVTTIFISTADRPQKFCMFWNVTFLWQSECWKNEKLYHQN